METLQPIEPKVTKIRLFKLFGDGTYSVKTVPLPGSGAVYNFHNALFEGEITENVFKVIQARAAVPFVERGVAQAPAAFLAGKLAEAGIVPEKPRRGRKPTKRGGDVA